MIKQTTFFLFLYLVFSTSTLHAQDINRPTTSLKFGKGFKITAADSSAEMKFNMRFQSLFNSERSLAEGESWESNF